MDGCTAINFVKYFRIVLSKFALFALHDLRELSQQSNNSCIRAAMCTQNLDGDSFDVLDKNC